MQKASLETNEDSRRWTTHVTGKGVEGSVPELFGKIVKWSGLALLGGKDTITLATNERLQVTTTSSPPWRSIRLDRKYQSHAPVRSVATASHWVLDTSLVVICPRSSLKLSARPFPNYTDLWHPEGVDLPSID